MTPPPRLELRGLRSALAGPFELELPPGQCAAVTGPSGAGKSLLLRLIADLDPGEGEVRLDGRPRQAFSPPDWRRQAIYVPAEAGWWAERVEQHFAPGALDLASDLGRRLGLAAGLFTAPVAQLSTGERQRMGLVRALALQPKVLLLDEPTGPLDPTSASQVETVLREALAGGAALVLVTHDPTLAARLGDRAYVLAERRFVSP